MNKQANNKLGSNPLMESVFSQVTTQTASPQKSESLINALIQRLKIQGIKTVTYRFSLEEVNEFNKMILDMQTALNGTRVNKNDVIRTGVNALMEDWKNNKTKSVIFQFLEAQLLEDQEEPQID